MFYFLGIWRIFNDKCWGINLSYDWNHAQNNCSTKSLPLVRNVYLWVSKIVLDRFADVEHVEILGNHQQKAVQSLKFNVNMKFYDKGLLYCTLSIRFFLFYQAFGSTLSTTLCNML